MEKARRYFELTVRVTDLRKRSSFVVTNNDIVAYIKEKYGFSVHSLYIAQVRDKLGIKLHDNYSKPRTSKRKVTICPDYKETAILDALAYFDVI